MNRREALRTLAAGGAAGALAAGAIVAVTPAEAVVPAETVSEQVNALFGAFLDLTKREADLFARIDHAFGLLPDWAKPGPGFMTSDGRRASPDRGWAELRPEDIAIPEKGKRALIRPNLKQVASHLFVRDPFDRAEVKAFYAKRRELRRQWVARRREQRAEEDRVGLRALQDEAEALVDPIYAASEAVRDFADLTGNADYAVAVMLLERHHDHSALDAFLPAFRSLAQVATGRVRAEAMRVLAAIDGAVA